jgi:hypothetical protein
VLFRETIVTVHEFFFQILTFVLGSAIGVSVPLLDKMYQKWVAGTLAILLIIIASMWTGYGVGVNDRVIPTPRPTVAIEVTRQVAVPIEVTRVVGVPVEVTRQVEVPVEVTRVAEVTRMVEVRVEVTKTPFEDNASLKFNPDGKWNGVCKWSQEYPNIFGNRDLIREYTCNLELTKDGSVYQGLWQMKGSDEIWERFVVISLPSYNNGISLNFTSRFGPGHMKYVQERLYVQVIGDQSIQWLNFSGVFIKND